MLENHFIGIHWENIEHAGVCFPASYVPHNVKMKYDGKEVALTPRQEEVINFVYHQFQYLNSIFVFRLLLTMPRLLKMVLNWETQKLKIFLMRISSMTSKLLLEKVT
jgi:hypothetical protein